MRRRAGRRRPPARSRRAAPRTPRPARRPPARLMVVNDDAGAGRVQLAADGGAEALGAAGDEHAAAGEGQVGLHGVQAVRWPRVMRHDDTGPRSRCRGSGIRCMSAGARAAGADAGRGRAQRAARGADARGDRARRRLDQLRPLHGARALRAGPRLLQRRRAQARRRRRLRHRARGRAGVQPLPRRAVRRGPARHSAAATCSSSAPAPARWRPRCWPSSSGASALPARYRILDVSADLRERQRATLAAGRAELARSRRMARSRCPTRVDGVIVANEVLDAMPVERFALRGGEVNALGVAWQLGRFDVVRGRGAGAAADGRPQPRSSSAGAACRDGYVSEVNLGLGAMARVAGAARSSAGVMLFVDYGLPRREYYSPERSDGTLLLPLPPPLPRRSVRAARPAGHHGLGRLHRRRRGGRARRASRSRAIATQAHFLIGSGIGEFVADVADLDVVQRVNLSRQAMLLTLPGEMGERFKVIALAQRLRCAPARLRRARPCDTRCRENMDLVQAIVLAIVQGLSEFLPISSSGHLILIPHFLGWSDQGLAFDVAVHVGTLARAAGVFPPPARHDGHRVARLGVAPPRTRATAGSPGRSSSATVPVGLRACCSPTSSRPTSATRCSWPAR